MVNPGTTAANIRYKTKPIAFKIVDFGIECFITQFVQGNHSSRTKPPVDFETKVPLWPEQARLGQAKAELLF